MTLRIDADDRIALLGANGNGKSTFAKLLAGRLKQETGSITVAPGLKVAIFAQHQLDDLRPDENAYEHVRRLMPDAPESKARARVAQFGLSTEKMNTPAKDLSGGEKARLLMGLSAFEGPNLFILDEPTNHLDIDSRKSLIHALNDFPGAVILISHDRHLLEATADRLWLVKDGHVNPYDGDLADYRQLVTGVSGDRREKREADKASKADRRREAAQRRAALEPVAKEIRATEALMDRIRKRIDGIEDELANPAVYEKDPLDRDAARQGALAAHRHSSPATRKNGSPCRPNMRKAPPSRPTGGGGETSQEETHGQPPHLHDEFCQRLSALCRQGRAQGPHRGRGRRDHRLADRLRPRGAGSRVAQQDRLRDLLRQRPALNPSRTLVTGVVCGVRVEDVEEPLMREIRTLDKLVDELAKGRPMDKILRKA